MAIERLDPNKPGTSGYWLNRLGTMLDDRSRTQGLVAGSTSQASTTPTIPNMRTYRDYYEGKHRLAFSTVKFREAFGALFSAYSENVCGVVVNSLVERLAVEGFRIGNSRSADDDAWRIWQHNNLDAEMPIGFREAAICGEVNLLVGPPMGSEADVPSITIEDPLESVVVVDRRRRVVALKRWYDAELGRWRAFVYYPDRIEKFWGPASKSVTAAPVATTWVMQEIDGDEPILKHDLGIVPMVPMAHRPNLSGAGMSELAEVVPLQDAINKLVADMIVASEFGAFRQRWATGIEIPLDPETGKPVSTFSAAVNRLWIGNPPADADEDAEARFGEFGQTDLKGFIEAIKQRLQMIATITRMPPHYLLGDPGSWPSGESLTAAETGLVAKAGDRSRDYADPIEEAMRIGFLMIGDKEKGAIRQAETIWRDPRFRTESEHIDAVVKLKALGIPDEFLWGQVPFTAAEITRIKALRVAAAREAAQAFDPDAARGLTTEDLEKRTEMLGVLIRAGYTADSAARFLGIDELEHTGHLPVTVQALRSEVA